MNHDATELTDEERRILRRAACAGLAMMGLIATGVVALVEMVWR